MTLQETDPDLPVSVQESPEEAWVGGGLLQGLRALSVAVHAWDLLKEVYPHYLHYLHHSLNPGK